MFVPIWESRHCLFEAWADEEMFEIIDHLQLAQASATPGNLDEPQKAAGLHLIQMAYSTTNTFQCCFLRLKVCLIPCVFSGIVGDEASLFLAELDDHYKAGRLTFNSDWFVCLALSDWQTPVRPSPKHPAGSSRRVKATLVWNN